MLGFGLYAAMVVGSAVIHSYLWVRLVRDTTRAGSRARRWGTGATVFSAVLAPGTRILLPVLGPSDGRWLGWPGYVWIAVLLYLLTGLALAELPRAYAARRIRTAERAGERDSGMVPEPAVTAGLAAVATGAGPGLVTAPAPGPTADDLADGDREPAGGESRRPGSGSPDGDGAAPVRFIDRRLFLGRTVGAIVGVSALGTVGYGMSVALGDPAVRRVRVKLAKLDPRAAGLRIAMVSDLHLGAILGRSHTERIVRMVNALEPDLVAVVGDLADGTSSQLGTAVQPLGSLRSRYGSYFVTGNHEYFYDDVDGWTRELRALGVRSLLNERVEIAHNGVKLDLAGVEDVTGEDHGRAPDLGRALAGRDTSRPVVLLAHQPVFAEEASRHGVDLQLSGHTHGGQMAPLTLIAGLSNPILAGLGTVGNTQVYVSRGAGAFGPPVRVGAPSDISLLELHPGSG